MQINNLIAPRTLCSIESLAAASFWIAIKADGSRACLPSRALLERACSVRAAVLSAVELVRAASGRSEPLYDCSNSPAYSRLTHGTDQASR